MRSLLVFILICTSWLCYGQSATALMARADSFGYSQLDSAMLYWERAGAAALEEGDIDLAIQAYDNVGGSSLFLDNHKKAVEIFTILYGMARTDVEKANGLNGMSYRYIYDEKFKPDSIFHLGIAHARAAKNAQQLVSMLGNYAVFLKRDGRLQQAIQYYLEAFASGPEKLQKMTLCVNLADLFVSLDNEDRAKEYVDEAIRIADENGYRARHQEMAVLEGMYFMRKGDLEKAEVIFLKMLSALDDKVTHSPIEAYVYLSSIRLSQNRLKEAQHFLDQSRSVKSTDETVILSRQDLVQGRLWMAEGKSQQAIALTEKVLAVSESNNISYQAEEAHELLSEYHEEIGDSKKAFYHFKEFKKIEESILKTNVSVEIFEQEGNFKRKEQADAIRLLDQQNQIQALKLHEKNRVIIFGGIGLLIFSVLSFFLYRLFQKVKQQKNIIKSSLDEKEILLREIHHRVKNNLQMVSSLLSLQSRYIKDEAALEAIQQSKSRVRTMALIHQDLYTNEDLQSIGVQDYLKRLCAELFHAYKIPSNAIQLQLEIEELALDVDTMIMVGLILNELVSNSLKYAFQNDQAGVIKVSFAKKGEQLILEVQDNGVGFDYEVVADKSFGFKLIQTLVKRMKGEVLVHRDGGSRVEVRLRALA